MDYVVELEFDGPGFVAVPNSVVDDDRLGSDALAALVYLARLAGGRGPRVVRVGAICARFRWGKDKWQRVARELRAVGALSDNFGRSDDGARVVRSLSVCWPKAAPARVAGPARGARQAASSCERENPAHRKNEAVSCERENPAHRAENPAQVCRKTRLLKEEHTGAVAAAAPSSKAAATAPGGRSDLGAHRLSRAGVAASLGLPVFDLASGLWLRSQAALEKGLA